MEMEMFSEGYSVESYRQIAQPKAATGTARAKERQALSGFSQIFEFLDMRALGTLAERTALCSHILLLGLRLGVA